MARRPQSGMVSRGSGGTPAFNLHNQNLIRATYNGGSRGQGFAVEFLSEKARIRLDEACVQGVIAIRDSSYEALAAETDETKQKMRSYLDAHFTGSEMHGNNHRRVSNAAVQSVFYDDVSAKGQYTSLIYSKFGVGHGAGFVDFLLLHMRGGTLRPKAKDWILIPNMDQPGARLGQAGRFEQSNSDIFFVKSKSDPGKLFKLRRYAGKGKTVLLATLVKSLRFEPTMQGLEVILASRGAVFTRHFDAVFGRKKVEAGLGG